jgi:predicted ABC-type sugar transport system permease subunit
MFEMNIKNQFTMNSEFHDTHTRELLNLHQPAPTLTGYEQGIRHSAVMAYNNLPPHIKQLSDYTKNYKLHFG